MNVLLINPSMREEKELWKFLPVLPNGLLYLAAYLERAGHGVWILDRNVRPGAPEEVLSEYEPDVVGVTSLTGECILDAVRLSRAAKRKWPTAPVVWGGVHATLLPDETLAEPYVDVVVRHEGEITMGAYCAAWETGENLADVEGLSVKRDGTVRHNPNRPFIEELNALPDPAWHLMEMDRYPNPITLNTSRGCPFRCAFCYNRAFNMGRRSELSSERIVRQMLHLRETYGAGLFKFWEDNFTMNRRRLEAFCDRLIALPGEFPWECEGRVGSLDGPLLKKMARSGCRFIGLGVESGSQRILDLLKKDITVGEIRETCRLCDEAGIGTYLYVMAGLPTETAEDFRATVRLIRELPHFQSEIMIYRPYPGSELYDLSVEMGLFKPPERLEDWGHHSQLHSPRNTIGRIPEEVLWKALVWNQRSNLWARVRFFARKRPLLLFAKVLNPWKMGRFFFRWLGFAVKGVVAKGRGKL